MRTVIVKVTANHIKKGERISVNYCPIALALRAKKYTHVNVASSIIFNNRSGRFIDVPLPHSVKLFIDRFDRGEKVRPFSFKIVY